jgi:Zn-dependent protease with chaperone function
MNEYDRSDFKRKHPTDGPGDSNRGRYSWHDRRRYLWYMVGVTGSVGIIYYIYHLERVPISGRLRFMNVTRKQEQMMGDMAFQSMIEEVGKSILPSWHPLTLQVRRVTDRLLASMHSLRLEDSVQSDMSDTSSKDLKKNSYQVYVIDDPTPNAMVLPSGQIFVFTGIFPIAKTESGLATVLGHEISHKLLRHHAERLSLYSIFIYFGLILQLLVPGSDFQFLNDLIAKYGVLLPNSRKTELEADRVGLLLVANACYDLDESVVFWERMEQFERDHKHRSRGAISDYLSTHPAHHKRIEQIKQFLPEAKEKRINAGCAESNLFSSFRKMIPIL